MLSIAKRKTVVPKQAHVRRAILDQQPAARRSIPALSATSRKEIVHTSMGHARMLRVRLCDRAVAPGAIRVTGTTTDAILVLVITSSSKNLRNSRGFSR